MIKSLCQVALIIGLSCAAVRVNAAFTQGVERGPFTSLKPGDYVWKPEVSPAGPVVIIVSVPEQTLYVYRNGVRIGRSTVSTGKAGHATPTGVFTVLQKHVHHESSLYKGAQMPYMERLTWGGVALHAGNLPGYPASHGCVRLPLEFAEKLYAVTGQGTTVIVADNRSAPKETVHPGYLLSGKTEGAAGPALPAGEFRWQPELAPQGPVSIIVSGADHQAYVYRNGVEIGRGAVTLPADERLGVQAFSATAKLNPDGSREWLAMTDLGTGGKPVDLVKLARRSTFPAHFLKAARTAIEPGATLIVTDYPVSRATQSGPGFNILSASAGSGADSTSR
ncbi:MAG: L,D-transpeptidase [Verrucomicrobia bacterium]|nr:L,D-transpeptidase [Verrucomicrobiota bacterium]